MEYSKEIEISTGIEPNFLQNILTKDISTLEALYDLVDNSIDAARNNIIQNSNYEKDEMGLPKSYKGYKVHIEISPDAIYIEDNCFGMEEETLVSRAFYIAKQSQHKFGIGQYGIGLKRSLLKMGSQYHFFMDNGNKCYESDFCRDSFSGSDNKILAKEEASKGEIKTKFTVTQIHSEIKHEIGNVRWLANALKGFKDRYSIFFSKGFEITINYNGKPQGPITSSLPGIRTDGLVEPTFLEEDIDGVKVIIESGIHEKYYLKNEKNHSISVNRNLTNDFGIYFICNDRVIVKASTSNTHGWKTKWHSEYNGFICLVRFISEEPSKLPWNTAKNGMREDSTLFLTAIEKIQPIAEQYRSDIKHRYSSRNSTPSNIGLNSGSSRENQNSGASVETDNATQASPAPTPPVTDTIPQQGNSGRPIQYSTQVKNMITYSLNIPRDFGKIRNIYLELRKDLKVHDMPYATAALLRSLIELSCDYYIYKTANIVFNDGGQTHKVSEPSKLREKILGVANHIHNVNQGLIDAKQLKTLTIECPRRNNDPGSLDILHSTLHNYSHEITPQQVIVAHNNFAPLIKAIWHS